VGFLHLAAPELPQGISILVTGWHFSEVQSYYSCELPIKAPHPVRIMPTMKLLTALVALTLVAKRSASRLLHRKQHQH
jgi:hypothetical protein